MTGKSASLPSAAMTSSFMSIVGSVAAVVSGPTDGAKERAIFIPEFLRLTERLHRLGRRQQRAGVYRRILRRATRACCQSPGEHRHAGESIDVSRSAIRGTAHFLFRSNVFPIFDSARPRPGGATARTSDLHLDDLAHPEHADDHEDQGDDDHGDPERALPEQGDVLRVDVEPSRRTCPRGERPGSSPRAGPRPTACAPGGTATRVRGGSGVARSVSARFPPTRRWISTAMPAQRMFSLSIRSAILLRASSTSAPMRVSAMARANSFDAGWATSRSIASRACGSENPVDRLLGERLSTSGSCRSNRLARRVARKRSTAGGASRPTTVPKASPTSVAHPSCRTTPPIRGPPPQPRPQDRHSRAPRQVCPLEEPGRCRGRAPALDRSSPSWTMWPVSSPEHGRPRLGPERVRGGTYWSMPKRAVRRQLRTAERR